MEMIDFFLWDRRPRWIWDRMERPSRLEMGMDDVDWIFPHAWHVKGAYERLNGGLTEKKRISWFNQSLARSLTGVSDVPIRKGYLVFATY